MLDQIILWNTQPQLHRPASQLPSLGRDGDPFDLPTSENMHRLTDAFTVFDTIVYYKLASLADSYAYHSAMPTPVTLH